MDTENKTNNKLWTRDFTIITLGSVISMLGNALAGFGMSLLVLDYTQSAFLYAIYIIVYTLPQMIMPIFSGAWLDRFSRKKMIYTLDFISAGMYVIAAVIMKSGFFNFPIFAIYCFLVGSINSIYMVAYESFYPLLITEGNFSKAYSISSVLETLSALMVPLSAFIYNMVGIVPLFIFNAISFFLAACFETKIKHEEKYIEKQKENESDNHTKQLFDDVKEGFLYLLSEKGLLAIAIYFTFASIAGGCTSVTTLPYFKGNYENGEYVFMMVWGMALLGRSLGGTIHYKIKLPVKYKYYIALGVYIITSLLEAFYLYTNIPTMMVMCLISGVLGITSYTIRISATQSYVPDEKKGRFNGAFNVLNTAGSLAGEITAGALTAVMSTRHVITSFLLMNFLAAVIIIGGNKKHVMKIYNTQN